MLVTCKSCGVSFQESLGRCVACRAEFVPSKEELVSMARVASTAMLEKGASFGEARNRLEMEFALTRTEAESLLGEVAGKATNQMKELGLWLAAAGVLAAIGSVFIGIMFDSGLILVAGLAAGSLAMFIGMFLFLSKRSYSGRTI